MIVINATGGVLDVEVRAPGVVKVVAVVLWAMALLATVAIVVGILREYPAVTIACQRAADPAHAHCTRAVDGRVTKTWPLATIRAVEASHHTVVRGSAWTQVEIVHKDGTRDRVDDEGPTNDESLAEYRAAAATLTAFLNATAPSVSASFRARKSVVDGIVAVFAAVLFGFLAVLASKAAGTSTFRFDRAAATLQVVSRAFPIGARRETIPLSDISEIDETKLVQSYKGRMYTTFAVELDRRSPVVPLVIAKSNGAAELAPLVAALATFLRVPVKVDP